MEMKNAAIINENETIDGFNLKTIKRILDEGFEQIKNGEYEITTVEEIIKESEKGFAVSNNKD